MLRRGSAGAVFCICRTFSSSVIRDTRSAARRSAGRSGLRYGWANARRLASNRIAVSFIISFHPTTISAGRSERMVRMRRYSVLAVLAGLMLCAQQNRPSNAERLWQLRNLGKAFYENPTTQAQAVEQFRQALALAPNSVRERVNYGLALLRAGKTAEGIAELEKAQKQDSKLPHSWFNLAIAYKRQADFDRAMAQLQGMLKLVPDEPVSHYQLGSLYKLKGDTTAAVKEFETARNLNPRLAAPHFQLYGLYRPARPEASAEELRIFQELKKQQEG